MRTLTRENLLDILYGCAILGTGGGGSLTEGASVVEKQWNAGKEFKLLDFSEIQDDAYYASPYYCGCMVPEEQEAEEEERRRERSLQQAMLDIKKKYGKNAILKGTNLLEGATAMERNQQIGGHRA